MNYISILKKSIFWTAVIFLVIIIFPPQKALAVCTTTSEWTCTEGNEDLTCHNATDGGSYGIAQYSCDQYNPITGEYYCTCHGYDCDVPCSSGGTPPPGDGGGCKSSEPAKPVCTVPKNYNFVSPNKDLFKYDKISFSWYFKKWNDCCSSSGPSDEGCRADRKFDVWVYADCSPPNAPTTGTLISFYHDKHTAFWNRNLDWRYRSKTLRRAPISTIGWRLDTNYCWEVSVEGATGKQNSSDLCYFTINSTSTPSPTPSPARAWWQAKDADIIASGSIRSDVPSLLNLILNGDGGFPGVAVYGSASNLTLPIIGAVLSSKNWKAQTDTNLSVYNYNSFNKKTTSVVFNPCPSDLSSIAGSHTNADPQGYVWYKCQSTDLNLATTGTANITDNKIVIMVDGGNVNIKTKINLTKGTGFFGVFTNRDINIYKTVGGSGAGSYDLEGIYFADGKVNTAYDYNNVPPAVTSSLKFRGSVVGMSGVELQRDLGTAANKTTPAEFFEYAPDQLFLLPSAFSTKKTQWQEVAP